MKKLVSITFLILSFSTAAQNIRPQSLYFMNQSMLNPAYIGLNDIGNITAISRGQWIGIDGAPFTHSLNGYSTFSDHSAVGINFHTNTFGINTDTEVSFNYAYRIDMLGQIISFGLQGGTVASTLNFDKLDTEVLDDPLIGNGRFSSSASTFGFGMMYKSDNFYIGAAVPRISETSLSDQGLEVNTFLPYYTFTGGFLLTPIDFFQIKPSFLAYYSGDDFFVDLNGQILINEQIWLGVTFRNLDAGGFNIIYTEDKIYHFGYSFQLQFNELTTNSYGTHELMISIDMQLAPRHRRPGRFF